MRSWNPSTPEGENLNLTQDQNHMSRQPRRNIMFMTAVLIKLLGSSTLHARTRWLLTGEMSEVGTILFSFPFFFRSGHHSYSHFIDKKMNTQKGKVASLRSHC